MSKVKRIFGAAVFRKDGKRFHTVEQVSEVLHILKQNGVDELVTARLYGNGTSEEFLGEAREFKAFTVFTKQIQ